MGFKGENLKYLGGKKRIAKQLCGFLNEQISINDYSYYFEPFVGSCAVIENIQHKKRYGNDANKYLISLYKSLLSGWIPPENLSEEEYKYIKEHKEENMPLTAFAAFGCSFSGKWFGGYCRDNTDRNYALNTKNSLLKQLPKIRDIVFSDKDYRECKPKSAFIYCDPPYANTTKYDFFNGFDNNEFWETMREWSKNNKVFISEYIAPEDFKCVLEIKTKTDLRNKEGSTIPRIEKLFTLTQ